MSIVSAFEKFCCVGKQRNRVPTLGGKWVKSGCF